MWGRSAFCGTVPGVAPAGRYPAPCFHGARTFLPGCEPGAAARPTDDLGLKRTPGQVKLDLPTASVPSVSAGRHASTASIST